MAFSLQNVFSSLKKKPVVGPRKVVGIDFGSSSIKVVEIEKNEGAISLSTYGELQLGPYADTDMGASVHLPIGKKIEALVDVLRESSVTSKEGVFTLPLSEAFVTVMSLPYTEGEDIAPKIPVEARKYIPVALTEVALEWSPIAPITEEKQPLTQEVLVAAIKNTSLREHTALLESVEMSTQPAEIELFSALRAITPDGGQEALVVIDLGAFVSKMYIAQTGFLRKIHRIQIGGSNITSVIAKELNCSFEDAENAKRNYGTGAPTDAVVEKVFQNAYAPVFDEFKRVIDQYQSLVGGSALKVVVTGGGALYPQMQQIVRYALNREVERSNPFNKINYPAFLEDTLSDITPIFAVALGAALRQFEQ